MGFWYADVTLSCVKLLRLTFPRDLDPVTTAETLCSAMNLMEGSKFFIFLRLETITWACGLHIGKRDQD